MSGAKFASITAGLLARKGEAQPWRDLGSLDKMPLAWRPDPPPAVMPQPSLPSSSSKDKSCSVRMSAHDYERLGILAVKAGLTRHQLLKQALFDLLAAKAVDYGCACLGACNRGCTGRE